MKVRFNSLLNSRRAFAIISLCLSPGFVHAETWIGGSGNWDTTSPNWSGSGWSNSAPGNFDSAIFGGASGVVTLTTGITVKDLTFNSNGYIVTGNTLTLKSGSNIQVANASDTTAISSTIAGTAGFTKTGNGTLTLTAANSYTGTTNVNAGTLQLGGGTTGIANFASASPIVIGTNGTLYVNLGNGSGAPTFSNTITGSGLLKIHAAGSLADGGGGNGDQLIISGASGFTGNILVTGGMLNVDNAANLGTGTITLDGAGLVSTGANKTVTQNIIIGSNGGWLRSYGGSNSCTYTGTLSGSGNITRTDGGMITLINSSASNTGDFRLGAGNLTVSGGNALGDNCAVILDGGTLTLNSNETIGALSGAQGVTLNTTSILTTGGKNTSTTYSGVLSGTGGLVKAGTGIFTLSGAAITSVGSITLQSGTLNITSGKLNRAC